MRTESFEKDNLDQIFPIKRQTHWPSWNTNWSRITRLTILSLGGMKLSVDIILRHHLDGCYYRKMMTVSFFFTFSPTTPGVPIIPGLPVCPCVSQRLRLFPQKMRQVLNLIRIYKHFIYSYLPPNRPLGTSRSLLSRRSLKPSVESKSASGFLSFHFVSMISK